MSDTKTFAITTITKSKFIAVEHGHTFITLSIIESSPAKRMEIEVSPKEAEKLAQDLLRRAKEIIEMDKG